MEWDASARLKAEERGAWARLFAIQPVNLDFRSKGLPRQALVPLGNAKQFAQFENLAAPALEGK
jgi:hypothetical protein